ncbi:hypothetical protein K8M07_03110 [Schnuerera sp. xch1]|uniref:hypothetical protein n=1 Tax=Schnuerera sp. xch1 TaxID=2874283 RepID=UPI001CBACDFE|nr:hypothetical protein [Schnuerera sp. xch1]MBZ2174231.1 hypothetical protein [Schnuerera sp. xch1]
MNRFQKFMVGRYGVDQFYNALVISSIILTLISIITGWNILSTIGLLFLFFAMFRVFSKNVNKRYQENMKFLQWWNPIKIKGRNFINRIKGRKTHRYLKCPQCRQQLRVPKGKGKIVITCPKCHTKFGTRT